MFTTSFSKQARRICKCQTGMKLKFQANDPTTSIKLHITPQYVCLKKYWGHWSETF